VAVRGVFGGLGGLWRWAFGRLADVLSIGKVAGSTGCELRCNQVVSGNEERLEAGFWVNHTFNPTFPCGVKVDAGDVGKNIETVRITPKAKETAAVCEVFRANALERRAELGERGIGRLRVNRVCFYEKVYVLRKAGLCVKDNGVSPTMRYLTPWAWKADKRSL
jgi:hypothetical protein